MSVKVGEFFLEMAVDAASGNLSVNQLVGALGKLDVVSIGTVGVLGKITDTLWGMAKAATGTAVEMSVLRDIAGTDPKIVQQWEKAAQRININAGSVVKAIQAVHDMNKKIEAGQGTPAVVGGLLGADPYKTDAEGKRALKDALDYITEFSGKGSRYQALTPGLQQTALEGMFGGASNDVFRMIKEMRAGKFRPQDISVLEDKQVSDLTKINRQEIEIGQKMVGIFEKLVLHGGKVAELLEKISSALGAVDKFISSKEGKETLNAAGRTAVMAARFQMSPLSVLAEHLNEYEKFVSKGLKFRPVSTASSMPPGQGGDLRGKLDISLSSNGKPLGTKTTFVDRSGTMREFWHVTDQMENTP